MYRTFKSAIEGWKPPAADVELLNRELARAREHERLVFSAGRFGIALPPSPDALDQVLWPVVRSASDLLTADALARMEDGESAQVMASGMGAIGTTLVQLCSSGDEILSGRTIYGGSYALMKNLLPRFGVKTRFVDTRSVDAEAHKPQPPRGPVRPPISRATGYPSSAKTGSSAWSRRPKASTATYP